MSTVKLCVPLLLIAECYFFCDNDSAAMQQIKDKDYVKPFKRDGRKIVLIGANFASDMSALDGVLVEEG